MVAKTEVADFVRALLKERFPKARNAQIEENTNLIGSGLVDSFAFMELLTDLETKFGVTVDVGAYEFDALTTLGGLCDAVVGSAA